jgi:hypothetical protein
MKLVRTLEASLSTLTKISNKILTTASSLRALAEPVVRHHGLFSLPLNAVSHIRSYLEELDNPGHPELWMPWYRRNKSFPLVCRKFRQLELSMPSLWTYITDRMPEEVMRLHISRSGNLDVKVHLCDFQWINDPVKSDLLFGIACRWSHLSIKKLDISDESTGAVLNNLHLPSLRELYFDARNEKANTLICNWHLPKLCAVSVSNVDSALALPLGMRKCLTRLKFSNRRTARVSMEKIIKYLSSSRLMRLTELEMDFFHQRPDLGDGPDTYYENVSLPTIQTLRMRCLCIGESRNFENKLFHALSSVEFPNVRRMELELSVDAVAQSETFVKWLSGLARSHNAVTVKAPPDCVQAEAQIFSACRNGGCRQVKILTETVRDIHITIEKVGDHNHPNAPFTWSVF